ncbi:hypothetical protein RRG08_054914 [Elysia crispata]|uniref:Uncharacterized protein n=1 Tax=Elysia crispata TaxID=231223 RepID=A0AAE1EEB8_9GAST|nr:hypothetical protein RRG08_054914 [Elysia crispata]
MEKLITDMNAIGRQYQEKVHALKQEPMPDRDGQICRDRSNLHYLTFKPAVLSVGGHFRPTTLDESAFT